MESKYYICEHINSCQHVGSNHCSYGIPTLKSTLDDLCGGTFKPKFSISCTHPEVNVGVMLIDVEHTCIEGNCRTIWTPF